MRVLITGATGFIGSHVARALVRRGNEVHALTDIASSRSRVTDLEGRVNWHPIERDAAASIDLAVRRIRPEVALNLGWYAEPGRYLNDAEQNLRSLQVSIQLLRSLLGAGCRRAVLAGTCLEQTAHSSVYAASKSSIHAVAYELRNAGLLATCAHVFYLYGPGEDPRRVIPLVARALVRGEPVSVGDGSQMRDYLHVADVAEAFCMLADRYLGPSVDICSGEAAPLRAVLETVGKLVGEPDLIQFGKHDPSVDGYPRTGDANSLRSAGWSPVFDLETGLQDTVRFWRDELMLARDQGRL